MKKRRRMGYVAVRPSDYVVHSRRGRVIRQGMGRSFFYLPATDRFCILPCTNNSIGFCADQITRENQGVEVTGFAIWKIAHPEATWLRFDFDGERDPIEAIGQYLKDVVEVAIRHQVANMSIEDVLRKRATIILELKRELAYITGQWGLEGDRHHRSQGREDHVFRAVCEPPGPVPGRRAAGERDQHHQHRAGD